MIKKTVLMFLLGLYFLAALASCAATSKHESTGEYLDDSVITTKVKLAIGADSTLKMFQIHVETYRGEVQLSGFVNDQQSVEKAAEIANRVKGVRSVINNLVVKPSP
jgi:osmotically-inducible protein OsmY